jgi:anti-sigma-K factor RskA
MTMDRHEEVAARLEEYVLGELSSDAVRDVEAHLAACAVCASDVRALSASLEGLASMAPPRPTTPALRSRVLAAIATEGQEPARHAARFGAASSRQRPWWSARRVAVAAGVMIAALAAVLALIDASRRQLATDVRRAAAETETLRERLRQYAGQTDLALSILTAADSREIPLAGRDNATASAARAYWSPTRGLLVVADRLPPPPPGRIYQVWVIASGGPLSAGLLGDQTGGRGMLIAPPPRAGVAGTVTVAVTDEPPGGLPAPSGTIRLAGSI